MNTHKVLLILAASAVIACNRPTETVCPANLPPAMLLTVVDSVSGLPPTAPSTIAATSQGVPVPIEPTDDNKYTIGFGRSGTFSVSAKTPGYTDWSASGIVVPSNSCGMPITVNLVARLQR